MSSTVIALLNAWAETPGMPPFPPFDDALADGNEHPPEQSECTPTDLAERGQEPGLEGPTPNVDETGSPGTPLVAIAISGCTGSGPLPCYGAICGFRSKWAGRRPFWGVSFSDSSNVVRGFYVRGLGYLRTRRQAQPGRIERVPEETDREDRAPTVFEGRSGATNPGCGYRTVERLFPETLDRVSEILLRRGILTDLPSTKHEVPKSCQGGKNGPFLATD
jgi:hypothetical protein